MGRLIMLPPFFKLKTAKWVLIILALQTILIVCGQSKCILIKSVSIAAPIIENRFVAHGKITGIKRSRDDMQQFTMQIERTELFKDFPCFGKKYQCMSAEIFSEIGIPSSFEEGAEISVILRVSGDEHKRTLFFVGELKNVSKDEL